MAEFVEDDGSGGYNVIVRPDWLANFTASGSGGTSPSTFAAEIAAQQGITSNPHNDVLQAAPAVSGTYDLSTVGGTTAMQTANCYLVNAPGTYSLPLVYGNAIDYAKYPANGKIPRLTFQTPAERMCCRFCQPPQCGHHRSLYLQQCELCTPGCRTRLAG